MLTNSNMPQCYKSNQIIVAKLTVSVLKINGLPATLPRYISTYLSWIARSRRWYQITKFLNLQLARKNIFSVHLIRKTAIIIKKIITISLNTVSASKDVIGDLPSTGSTINSLLTLVANQVEGEMRRWVHWSGRLFPCVRRAELGGANGAMLSLSWKFAPPKKWESVM